MMMREESETSSKEIRIQMAAVRQRMQQSARELARLSEARKHWTNYIREAPFLAAGSAFLIGYLLIPKKRPYSISLDTKKLSNSSKDREVKIVAPKNDNSTGIVKTSLKMAGRSLLHLGIRTLLEQVQQGKGMQRSNKNEQMHESQ